MNLKKIIVIAGLSWAGMATSQAALLRPVLETEMSQCRKSVGVETPAPASDYAGGISSTANALTPAGLRGVTTVSPKIAACLLDAMAEDLKVLQVVGDETGIADAFVLPMGAPRELSAQEQASVASFIEVVTSWSKDAPILVYCHHTSCFLSYNAALRLRDAGYTKVLWMREGIKGWKEAGYPTGPVRKNGNRQLPEVKLKLREIKVGDTYPVPPNYYDHKRPDLLKAETGVRREALCLAVHNHMKAQGTGIYAGLRHQYEVLLYQAAKVDPTRDHIVTVRKKMRQFWTRYENQLTCRGVYVVSHDGISLLKTAVIGANGDFIDDAVRIWRLPLDKVDLSDGLTVLDLTEYHYSKNVGGALESRYVGYFTRLREAGAHYRSELEASGDWKRPELLQREAVALHRAAAQKGEISSSWYLFWAYWKGYYQPADQAEALRWLERLKQQAIAAAATPTLVSIGQLYSDAGLVKGPLPVDEAEAVRWFRRAADGGDASGMLWLGRAHVHGNGVAADIPAGIGWLKRSFEGARKANESGEAAAEDLGIAYDLLGDYPAAARWLRGVPASVSLYEGVTVGDWFKKHKLDYCGETNPGLVNRFCS